MVNAPIETAKDWLQTAKITSDAGIYGQSIYALEMAVEIALKAVLLSVHVDVPKVHDVRKTVKTFIVGNKDVPKSFRDGLDHYMPIFETLLNLRAMVGYGFEGGAESKELEMQAKTLIPKCSEIILACEKAIKIIGKN